MRQETVVLSKEKYDNLLETLELLGSPNLIESLRRSLQQVKNGETYSLDEVLGDD